MIIKKFVVESESEAEAIVRKELGPEAMVLTTRYIKSGFRGKESVEVTAAIEAEDLEAHQNPQAKKEAGSMESLGNNLADLKKIVGDISHDVVAAQKSRGPDILQLSSQARRKRTVAATPTPVSSAYGATGRPIQRSGNVQALKAGKEIADLSSRLVSHFSGQAAAPEAPQRAKRPERAARPRHTPKPVPATSQEALPGFRLPLPKEPNRSPAGWPEENRHA